MKDLFFVKVKPLYAFVRKTKNDSSSYINPREIKSIDVYPIKDKNGKVVKVYYGVVLYGNSFAQRISKKDYERLKKL